MRRILRRLASAAAVPAARLWFARPRQPGIVVLGAGMAAAHEAEQRRLADRRPDQKSPLRSRRYNRWAGELRLSNAVRVRLDDEIAELTRAYRDATDAARLEMRQSFSLEELYTLMWFSSRAAVFALRGEPTLEDAVTAMAMVEAERVDYRDVPFRLSVVEHASERAGADTRQLFADGARIAEPAVAVELNRIAKRPSKHKALCSACIHAEVQTSRGIGLTDWWGGRYAPTIDLSALAVQIVDDIEGAGLQMKDPVLGADPPSFWFDLADRNAQRALRSTRAVISLHGDLRPDLDPMHIRHGFPSQGVLGWLIELRDERVARVLLESARQPNDRLQRRGTSHGRLFCLLVAREWEYGGSARQAEEKLDELTDIVSRRLGPRV